MGIGTMFFVGLGPGVELSATRPAEWLLRHRRPPAAQVCREADGYQAHLVSPEKGIRRLVAEAMSLTNDSVHKFVDDVHMVLMETVGAGRGCGWGFCCCSLLGSLPGLVFA